ncbi:hypothetical protein BgiMline_035149 [Biomphalaria glabrata]|uniref:Uncharacterized protein LOC106072806 n=1 Tax=Biomphalaria glabrata TaxID=6526 RepID=A0A2C9LYC3_BIOGL|nr:uncharacterized protein LOC106072806 [Biomphalaria glabrata]KAI8736878.1 hypothetical protein BgiMline_026032 [Biomphalaria glabrata]KAI8776885.1 hypothetical protein BgiBS90_022633 [Biomphalaria glabrata]
MATEKLFKIAFITAIAAFITMFVGFASPYWYKSWTRVFSPFGTVGLWHVCLNGFIKPRDPVMKSYVGCWWIHSTEFSDIEHSLQPVWFRFVQAFSIIALFGDLLGMIFTLLYIPESPRQHLYKHRPRMFFINSALLLGSAFLVFLIALVFAEMSNDSTWMPRPWMNYLSWSYGLVVLSGFCSALSGMCVFLLALIYQDKEENGDPGVTSAAELNAKRRELEKQDEAMRAQPLDTMPSQYGGYSRPPYGQQQDRPDYGKAPSVAGSRTYGIAPPTAQKPRVGESFV